MGFFSELKEALQTGGEYITKTVSGRNTEVGRMKIEMIESMKREGYSLVNEVSRQGYIEGFLGDVPATSYTLTFRKDPELTETLRKEQEARVRQEREEARLREEARQKELDAEEEYEAKCDQIQEELTKSMGTGYCVYAEGSKENIKSVTAAIKAILQGAYAFDSNKLNWKLIPKAMKKFGGYYMLTDFGENACNNLAKLLSEYGAKVTVIPYHSANCADQKRLLSKVRYDGKDIFSSAMETWIYCKAGAAAGGEDFSADFRKEYYSVYNKITKK